jgi:hypothetical protein
MQGVSDQFYDTDVLTWYSTRDYEIRKLEQGLIGVLIA